MLCRGGCSCLLGSACVCSSLRLELLEILGSGGLLQSRTLLDNASEAVSVVAGAGAKPEDAAAQSQMSGQQCFTAYNPSTLRDYQQVGTLAHLWLPQILLGWHVHISTRHTSALQVVATWVQAILTLVDHIASHPTASTASHNAEQDQQPQPKRPQDQKELAQ